MKCGRVLLTIVVPNWQVKTINFQLSWVSTRVFSKVCLLGCYHNPRPQPHTLSLIITFTHSPFFPVAFVFPSRRKDWRKLCPFNVSATDIVVLYVISHFHFTGIHCILSVVRFFTVMFSLRCFCVPSHFGCFGARIKSHEKRIQERTVDSFWWRARFCSEKRSYTLFLEVVCAAVRTFLRNPIQNADSVSSKNARELKFNFRTLHSK